MAMDADTLLDRLRLKRQIRFWRLLAIVAFVATLAALTGQVGVDNVSKLEMRDYVARFQVEGMILDDIERDTLLKEVKENQHIKAVIVHIDSPGGTAVGGERLYKTLLEVNQVKPVVAVMKTMATSAAYMSALATERIFAQEGTITGSIGVIMQLVRVTELAEKIGLQPVNYKSAPLKATPSPLEEGSEKVDEAAQALVDAFFSYFKGLVKKERRLDENTLALVTDGRVFTGAQAIEYQLVDAIGSEHDAIAWLEAEKGLKPALPVKEIEVERDPEEWFRKALGSMVDWVPSPVSSSQGLLAIWRPAQIVID